MLDLAALFAEGLSAFGRLLVAIPMLKDAGASAVIIADNERSNLLNAFARSWGTQINHQGLG